MRKQNDLYLNYQTKNDSILKIYGDQIQNLDYLLYQHIVRLPKSSRQKNSIIDVAEQYQQLAKVSRLGKHAKQQAKHNFNYAVKLLDRKYNYQVQTHSKSAKAKTF